MAIQGFDYKGFAQNLAGQAQELVPKEFDDNQKAYVTNTLLNFSMLAGEALYNDNELGFNAEQATMITQIIAEWSYHKSVDLVRSGIPQQYWDPVMQKIAFTIFEIAKQTFKQGLPQDQILQLIEHHVKKAYTDSINELKEKKLIDDDLADNASKQSNIDAMMEQMQESGEVPQENPEQHPEEVAQPENSESQPVGNNLPQSHSVETNTRSNNYAPPKLLKLVTLALLLKRVDNEKVQSILERFDQDVAGTVIKYMYVDGLEEQVDPTLTMKCLDDIAEEMPNATEINKNRLVEKIKLISQDYDKNKLEQALQLERQNVRRFVFNAVEGEYYDISPRVANVIATYLEHGV